MKYNPEIHQRHSIRLKGYDYAEAGAYFVTICVQRRECLFGEVVEGHVRLSPAGETVQAVWEGLPERFSSIELDAAIIMPNHFHGIIVITESAEGAVGEGAINYEGAMNCAPTAGNIGDGSVGVRLIAPRFTAPGVSPVTRVALGEIIRVFKAVSTRLIRRDRMPEYAWQRNYYERVIRNEGELERARAYIAENPQKWAQDTENPANVP